MGQLNELLMLSRDSLQMRRVKTIPEITKICAQAVKLCSIEQGEKGLKCSENCRFGGYFSLLRYECQCSHCNSNMPLNPVKILLRAIVNRLIKLIKREEPKINFNHCNNRLTVLYFFNLPCSLHKWMHYLQLSEAAQNLYPSSSVNTLIINNR